MRAIRIGEQQQGPESSGVTYPLNGLGDLYKEQARYAEAEPLCQRAIRILEQLLGPEHPHVAYALKSLGDLSKEQGKYAEAESLYQRALRIGEEALGSEHPQVVNTLKGSARLYCERGRYEAEPLYQRMLSVLQQPSHPKITAEVMHTVALFQAAQGNSDEAITVS